MKHEAPRDAMAGAGTSTAQVAAVDDEPASANETATKFKADLAFHLTGHRIGKELSALEGRRLRPALLAGYRDLSQLRYDFPLVLTEDSSEKGWLRSLSDIVDELLCQVAPQGPDGEKTRRAVLRLESAIKKRLAAGGAGALHAMWDEIAGGLTAPGGESLGETLDRARAALKVNGEIVDCDAALPGHIFVHAWRMVQANTARRLRAEIDQLILKLSDILKADFVRSAAGRSSENLRASVGPAHEQTFDFDAMSRLLSRNSARETLPKTRRKRISRALAVLQSQKFVPPAGSGADVDPMQGYPFVFGTCAEALNAFRTRLPELIELVKTIAIAELEIDGRYIEPAHDMLFDQFDEDSLGPRDLRLFPDYLVCMRSAKMSEAEFKALIDVLSSGLPIKILVQTDDLLPPVSSADSRLSLNLSSMRLASMALGLSDVFVLQSSASNLYQAREQIFKGMSQTGPALFSVYSGVAGGSSGLPPYLASAAAMQSRAFPTFAYDPSAGPDWAARFSLADNPQPDQDWPQDRFAYEDESHQRIEEDIAFTFVDFVACDERYGVHFAAVSRADWNSNMVPLVRGLTEKTGLGPEEVPYVLMVDEENRLQRAIVHDKLLLAANRCREMWHSLQEMGGIHSSQAEKHIASERKIWEEAKQMEIEAIWREARTTAPAPVAALAPAAAPASTPAPVPAAPSTAVAAEAAAAAEAPEEEAPSDDPYIETPRCTTCNECTDINNRMFAYDSNKQAYIADPNAGTYRELVEAAESCQVSIIHPGKPRNPKEPNLEELLKRAAPFL